MGLTYELLLDLYRGRSSAVEQITNQEHLGALAIETPVTHLLRQIDAAPSPRHVVLTGSAGDGKTFATLTVKTSFYAISDASARRAGVDLAPVDDLALHIEKVLGENKRLLLAINRGQLERLFERTRSRGGVAAAFVDEVRQRTVLRDTWSERSQMVAVADLGHLDRTTTAAAIMKKVAEMPDPAHLAAPTREAFRAARKALAQSRVQEWILSVVRAATAAGTNVTMRQLWSFISFLATGARGPSDVKPLSMDDAVGARIFDATAEGPLFEVARERCDPALTPNATLARDILSGALLTKFEASDFSALVPKGMVAGGRVLTRVAVVHGVGVDLPPTQPRDDFAEVVKALMALPPGPQAHGVYPRTLLRGIYKALGLWHSANVLPGWQTLCFDSSRLGEAAAVSDSLLNTAAFKLALPRPPPEVAPYLEQHWRPPFVWLTAPEQPRLRLSPRTFRYLLSCASGLAASTEPEDLFALDNWLRRLGRGSATMGAVAPDGDPAKLRVSRRSSDACVVLEDSLHGKTSLSVE